jgi:hypothetical protein
MTSKDLLSSWLTIAHLKISPDNFPVIERTEVCIKYLSAVNGILWCSEITMLKCSWEQVFFMTQLLICLFLQANCSNTLALVSSSVKANTACHSYLPEFLYG